MGNNKNIPYLIDSNGTCHSNDKAKCNLLANHFAKYFIKITIPEIVKPNVYIKDIEFDLITISKVLEKLPGLNSISPDGIPYILLKRCYKTISPLITEIFRIILDSGNIPAIWKTSYIIPIYKKVINTMQKTTDQYLLLVHYVEYLKEF
ncbi:hypothetical protein ACQ4LE_001587 [Meloidogyne hapla]